MGSKVTSLARAVLSLYASNNDLVLLERNDNNDLVVVGSSAVIRKKDITEAYFYTLLDIWRSHNKDSFKWNNGSLQPIKPKIGWAAYEDKPVGFINPRALARLKTKP